MHSHIFKSTYVFFHISTSPTAIFGVCTLTHKRSHLSNIKWSCLVIRPRSCCVVDHARKNPTIMMSLSFARVSHQNEFCWQCSMPVTTHQCIISNKCIAPISLQYIFTSIVSASRKEALTKTPSKTRLKCCGKCVATGSFSLDLGDAHTIADILIPRFYRMNRTIYPEHAF